MKNTTQKSKAVNSVLQNIKAGKPTVLTVG